MSVFILLGILALAGIGDTLYLIHKRKMEEKPICLIGNDCHKVLTSKYNRIFGIHNDVAGFSFYLLTILLIGLIVSNIGDRVLLTNLLGLLVAGSALISAILVFVQWRLIKAWCFWCLLSAVNNWTMAGILAFHMYK